MSNRVNILRYILMSLAVCLSTLLLSGQEIRTDAPKEVFGKELFQIQYEVISIAPIRQMPKFVVTNDFELVAEPQLSKTVPSPFWGDEYYILKISCTFRAKKIGKLNLPRIELLAEGQTISSKKGTILVRDLPNMDNVKYFVRVSATQKEVNVGDTLTLTYKLYSSQEVSNIGRIKIPGLRHFHYQDLSPEHLIFTNERIDGVDYKVYEIRKFLIQPLNLGTKVLEEGSVDIEYTYPTGRTRTDSWGRSYDEQLREIKTCIIQEMTILVHDMIAI